MSNSFQVLILLSFCIPPLITSSQTIRKGFDASPTLHYSNTFQSILTDPTSVFAFGFLPNLNSTTLQSLDLVVLHLPSNFPLWRAKTARQVPWSTSTSLSFNGSLLLSNPKTGLLWSTPNVNGETLTLLNSSDLQILRNGQPIWQSFDYPLDSIVQDQNLTAKSAIVSENGLYSLRLGPTYMGLYMEQPGRPMYWKRTAMQAKAEIVEGEGPIYARVDPTGFLGLYQSENKPPVDVISFDTFNGGVEKNLRRLTLESDGNLKAYYWSGSGWVSDYKAISELCDLPSGCGAYGMCHVDGQVCGGCVDNSSTSGSGCFEAGSGDFCSGSEGDEYRVVRRSGVDLANKELIGFEKVGTLEECEGLCDKNCSCWGAVYSNVSGYCYRVDYPIQTLLDVGDERKVGYFKVRNVGGGGEGKRGRRRKKAGVVLAVVGASVLVGCGLFACYRVWRLGRQRSDGEDAMGMMSYKDLKSSSFRSIEMSNNSFKK